MKYFLTILIVFQCACSNVKRVEQDTNIVDHEPEIFGYWYFHMGTNGYLKLQLQTGYDFNVFVITCSLNKEEQKPSGTWKLQGEEFLLIWPDGTEKRQKIISIGHSELKLTSKVGYERYYREPTGCKKS